MRGAVVFIIAVKCVCSILAGENPFLGRFSSSLEMQGNYLRSSINGSGSNFPSPHVVRLATFGDSMAQLKSACYSKDLWSAYGFGGRWLISSDPQTFGISESGDVINHTGAANPNGYDYSVWITGEYRDIGVSGSPGILTTIRNNSAVGAVQSIDTISVVYVMEPGAGTFKVQSSENGGPFFDEPGYANVSADGSKASSVITIQKARQSDWQMRVIALTGRVKITLFGKENRASGGVCLIDLSRGGLDYPNYNTATHSMLDPVFSEVRPHLITSEFKESVSGVRLGLPVTVDNLNAAIASGGASFPDWLFIMTSPDAGEGSVAVNLVVKEFADSRGYSTWDGYFIGKDYPTMLAMGWLTLVDGTHPTQSFNQYSATMMAQDCRFFTGPAGRLPIGMPSQPTGFKNRVFNGRLDAWSNGTSFTVTTASANLQTADTWYLATGGGYDGSVTVSRRNFLPGEIDDHSQFYIRMEQTAPTSSSFPSLVSRTASSSSLSGGPVAVSFWAKSAAPITLENVELLQEFGSGGSSSVNTGIISNVLISTTWRRFAFTAWPPSNAGKTVGAGNALAVRINVGNGGAAWALDVWGLQIERGLTATDLEWTPFGTIAFQNHYSVNITGGSVAGLSTLTANNPHFSGTTTVTGNVANGEILRLVANPSQGNGILSIRNSSLSEMLRVDGNGNLFKSSGDFQLNTGGNSILIRPNGSESGRFSSSGIEMASGRNAILASGFYQGFEQTEPAAPAANGYRIYAKDNGSGKTVLYVRFASGAEQQLAIEP